MILNKNSQLSRFYRWSYGRNGNLPDDFCAYFWKLLFAFLFVPVTWWTLFPQRFFSDLNSNNAWIFGGRVFGGLATSAAFDVVGYVGFLAIDDTWAALKWVGIVAAISVGVLSVFAIIGGLVYFFGESDTAEEIKNIISTKADSVKNDYCPKIEWK